MTLDFSLIIHPLVAALTAVAVIASIYLSTIYRARIAKVRRHARAHAGRDIPASLPPLSVIVYSKDSAERLEQMLPLVFEQQYPGEFEVIVATDGRSSQSEDVITRLSAAHRNLRMTYVPDEAHALSRKKLAVTLGIKAARYGRVLLTDANVAIPSPDWLALMARHFVRGKDVVIGISGITDRDGNPERGYRAFDTLADTVTYLTAAIKGKPYRGSDRNIAFTRQLFFDHNGFADSVQFHHGIDDIFVSRIADGSNTAVELVPEAEARLSCDNLRGRHLADKLQHIFTGRRVDRSSRRFFGFGSVMMYLWLAATVAAGWLAYPNLLPAAVCLAAGLISMTVVSISWSRAAKALGMPMCIPMLPLYLLRRPFATLAYRLRARSFTSKNYTWAKPY